MKKQTIIKLLIALLIAVVSIPAISKDVNAAVATWTVTYHTNGGDSIPSERVQDGDYCRHPTPTREGYVFRGWYTDAELTRYYGGSAVYENLDLYAKWDVLVSKVEASVNLPVAGEHPNFRIAFTSGTHCSNPRSDCLVIDEMNANGGYEKTMYEEDEYRAGTTYRFLVWFSPDTGYDYSRLKTQAYINGIQATWWTSIGDGRHTCGWYIDYTTPDDGIKITQQPTDASAAVGSTAKFSVVAESTDSLTYQWQSRKGYPDEWVNSGQSGAKSSTLSVNTTAGLDGWQFRCLIRDTKGNQECTTAVTLNVNLSIVTQPKNAKVPVGDIAEFTVAAAGKASLSYQWQSRKDSSSAWSNSGQQGAKTATLKVKTSAGLHGWQFRCVVTDGNGKQKASNAAKLSVVPKFTTNPKSVYAAAGSTAKFTVAATGKAPLSYQWQSRKDASSAWTNSGQQGAKTATLSVAATNGLNGWQFRCVVTDENGMSWGSGVATLYTQLSIRTQPKNTTTSKGSKVQLTIEAYGKASLSYQWQSRKNSSSEWTNSALPGAKTATLDVTATAGLNGYQFRCIVTDGNGKKLPSKEATLTVK